MRILKFLFGVLLLACGSPDYELQDRSVSAECSREEVLRRLGIAIERADPGAIRAELLSPSDLLKLRGRATTSGEPSERTFDNENLNTAALMVNAIRRRMRHPRFQAAEVGSVGLWQAEGTEMSFAADEGSHLTFKDDDGISRIPVERLVLAGGCWRIESIGYGVTNRPKRGKTSVPLAARFELVTQSQLCTGLGVYAAPRSSEGIGELVEQYTRYRDSRTGQTFPAVLLKTHIDGHIKGRWKKLEKVFVLYFRTDDEALANCHWNVRDEEVTADPVNEIAPE